MVGVAILGSTGSIGVSTLEVIAAFPDRYRVVALAAGRNISRLLEQIQRFGPQLVSVADEDDRRALYEQLVALGQPELDVRCGTDGAIAVATQPDAAVVISAMVGAIGLRPTLAAIQCGRRIALANKECLVVAGQLCLQEARRFGATLIPVDSEHSAIYQILSGRQEAVRRLILTGSGGPFRQQENLEQVTVDQALAHPVWSMGPKISIDSATLMNKGLEVIEARWLFDRPAEQIQVLIHPESIVHSLVEYMDGALIAQLGTPDMRTPISYALSYPERLPLPFPRLDLTQIAQLTFEPPSFTRFPCLRLAYAALAQGGTTPAVLNAANEVAVHAFLQRQIPFTSIPQLIEETLARHQHQPGNDLEELLEADSWAREQTRQAIGP